MKVGSFTKGNYEIFKRVVIFKYKLLLGSGNGV